MEIPLVVALWEHAFSGRKRLFVENASNLEVNAFNDKVSSIGIHPGPDYAAWMAAHGGKEPTVGFYEHPNYGGAVIVLTKGVYPNIETVYNFNDRISSLKFQPVPAYVNPISPIKVVVQLYEHPNYTGKCLVVVENSPNISLQFGSEFNDVVSSVIVKPGPNFTAGDMAHLYRDNDYKGGGIDLKPERYPNIFVSHGFDNVVSSIEVL